MNRVVVSSVGALALLSLGACKGKGTADAAKLVPDAAVVIGGVDVAAMMKSPLYSSNEEALTKGEAKEMLDAAKACKVGPDAWKSLVFGLDPEGEEDAMVVVAVATGIGKKETLECIAEKAKEANDGKAPWTMEEKGGKLVLTIEGATGYAVNDNMVAVAGKDWAGAVLELIDGKGKPAVDNSLKDVLARTNTKKTIWAAGKVPASMAEGPTEGMIDGAMWVDMSSGIELMASVGVRDAETAESKAKDLQGQFEQLKGMAGGFGVPKGMLDSVKIEAKKSALELSAKASTDDVKELSELVKKQLGS